jgi:hypothetical protein
MPNLARPTVLVRDSFVEAARRFRDEGWLPGFPVEEVAASLMPLFARLCRLGRGPLPTARRYRRSRPSVRARLTASSRLCTPSRWYKRSARSFAADREMPSLSAMTEKGTGCGR